MTIAMEMTMEEAKVVAAMRNMVKSEKDVEDGFDKQAKAATKFEKAGVRAYEASLTPQQKYEKGIKAINAAQKRGKLTDEQRAQAQEHLLRQMQRQERAGSGAFGDAAISRLASYAGGVVSIGTAVSAVSSAWQKIRDDSNEAGEAIARNAMKAARIAQLARNPEQFEAFEESVTKLREDFGLDEDKASDIFFAARSAGLEKDTQLFGESGRFGFNPDSAIEAVQKIRANFGEEGGGTSRQILAKILAAAEKSPVGAEQLAKVAATPASPFSDIGGEDEELLALVSQLAIPFKSAEEGAQRLKTLSEQINKKRHLIDSDLKGLPLMEAMQGLAEQGKLKNEAGESVSVKKFLGEQNAISALQTITKPGVNKDIHGALAAVNASQAKAGTKEDAVTVKGGIISSSPKLSGEEAVRKTKQQEDITDENIFGTIEQVGDIIQSGQNAKRKAEMGAVRKFLGGMVDSAERFYDPIMFVRSRSNFKAMSDQSLENLAIVAPSNLDEAESPNERANKQAANIAIELAQGEQRRRNLKSLDAEELRQIAQQELPFGESTVQFFSPTSAGEAAFQEQHLLIQEARKLLEQMVKLQKSQPQVPFAKSTEGHSE